MAKDPYAVPAAGFSTPYFTYPPAPKEPNNPAYQLSPEELDRLLAQGYTIYEDGSLVPPDAAGGDASLLPQGLAREAATWDNPIFAAHMAIRNPPPAEADPLAEVMKQQRKIMGGGEGKAPLSVTASPAPTPDYQQADQARQGPGLGQSGPVWPGRVGRRMSQQPLPPRNRMRR